MAVIIGLIALLSTIYLLGMIYNRPKKIFDCLADGAVILISITVGFLMLALVIGLAQVVGETILRLF